MKKIFKFALAIMGMAMVQTVQAGVNPGEEVVSSNNVASETSIQASPRKKQSISAPSNHRLVSARRCSYYETLTFPLWVCLILVTNPTQKTTKR